MSTLPATLTVDEQLLLRAAQRGDEEGYRRLVEHYRGELLAHCYRMLGSVHDAEDSLQDALLRAWRALPRFEGRSSLRAWLYRIATNTCLDLIARRPQRVLPLDAGPRGDAAAPAEATWLEPWPDATLAIEDGRETPEATYERRESVELAFVAALQHLPGLQRAVLILRTVLGFSAREVADVLETTPAAVNSALQRARRTVDERLPERSQQATLRAVGDERQRELVQAFSAAMEQGDVEAMLGLLTDDAGWCMPPHPASYVGHDAIRGFLVDGPMPLQWRHRIARANGQLAIGCFMWDPEREAYAAAALNVLELRDDRIGGIVSFLTPWLAGYPGEPTDGLRAEAWAQLGLPPSVAP